MFATPCHCSRRHFLGRMGTGFGALALGGCFAKPKESLPIANGFIVQRDRPTMTNDNRSKLIEDYQKWIEDYQAKQKADEAARRSAYPLKGVARVFGVYPVKADEPCHLVELVIEGSDTPVYVGDITQEIPGRDQALWQVPWEERVLDEAGQKILASYPELKKRPELLRGKVRLVFFLHYLDLARPLITPFGELPLPPPSKRPPRLKMVRYEPPD
jgi:hypothetical protein